MIPHTRLLVGCLSLSLACAVVGCGGNGGAKKKPAAPPVEVKEEPAPAGTETPAGESKTEAAAGGEEGWGTIKGQIVWGGDVPATELLVKKGDPDAKDAAVCAVQDVPKEEVVVNQANKGLRWVIVSLGGKPKIHPDHAAAEGSVELGQQHCQFQPHVVVMRAGQKFVISSNDPVAHNTKGDGFKNPGFNPVVPPAPADGKSQLDGPELVAETRPMAISCSIHPWMKAWLGVFDHPYFAVTDEDGNFEIKDVPAGAQKLVIWHEKGYGEGMGKGKDITIKAGETTDLGKITYNPPK